MSEIFKGIVYEKPAESAGGNTDETGIVQKALNSVLDNSPEGLSDLAALMKYFEENGNPDLFVQSDPRTGTITEIKKG